MKGRDFVNSLIEEIEDTAFRKKGSVVSQTSKQEISAEVIKNWLNFAVYYERCSAAFVGGWLQTTEQDDVFHHFAHQVEDEANHYRWLKRLLGNYGASENAFVPPPTWKYLMEIYYPNLESVVERLAAHNIASETGAIGFMEYGYETFPLEVKKIVRLVMKDEKYHVSFGSKLLAKYCTTKNLQKLARDSAYFALENMEKARDEFIHN